MHSVCLYCSAVEGLAPNFVSAATEFGTACARRGWRLVYGGSRRGLMGDAAKAAMAAGGTVVGIIPECLVAPEVANRDITELKIVDTLARRKEMMIEMSEAFICLPGGIGTLDELLETITTFDLGLHTKPTLLCNVDGFWDPFQAMIQAIDARGVLRQRMRRSYQIVPDVDAVMAALEAHFAS